MEGILSIFWVQSRNWVKAFGMTFYKVRFLTSSMTSKRMTVYFMKNDVTSDFFKYHTFQDGRMTL